MKSNYKIKKMSSGIPGFDNISHGGIPVNRTTLLSGPSGSGKTTFAMQFIWKGIVDSKENGVFVSFEERPDDVVENMKSFGWNLEAEIKNHRLAFVDATPEKRRIFPRR